jgi:hypothetical protein
MRSVSQDRSARNFPSFVAQGELLTRSIAERLQSRARDKHETPCGGHHLTMMAIGAMT